ncbi:hypothetical protein V0M98_33735 (plasmid) [Pseudomonas silesiensis]|uniref:hypothetical protein n=1 Tax=Pseudomonas silesiensis TaxID=1853130 RepID=UPI0030D07DCF
MSVPRQQNLISAPVMPYLELSLGVSVCKAATEMLFSMAYDTSYEVGPLQQALNTWAIGKAIADARAIDKAVADERRLFETWFFNVQINTQYLIFGSGKKFQPPLKSDYFFRFGGDGNYVRESVRKAWDAFSEVLSLTDSEVSIDLRRDLDTLRTQVAALQYPDTALVNMLNESIAKLSAPSIS